MRREIFVPDRIRPRKVQIQSKRFAVPVWQSMVYPILSRHQSYGGLDSTEGAYKIHGESAQVMHCDIVAIGFS